MTYLTNTIGFIFVTLAILLGGLKYIYGGPTKPFTLPLGKPIKTSKEVQAEIVAVLDEAPGNIAVSKEGRVFINYHPEGHPTHRVLEIIDGKPVPWPNEEWQSSRGNGEPYFDNVFSLRIDRQDRLWTLDTGFHGLKQPRLLAFNYETKELVHRWDIPKDVAGYGSYTQDFQVSNDGKFIFIADIGIFNLSPSIIVYDIEAKKGRRVLENHPSVVAKPYDINAKGHIVQFFGLYNMHPSLDSIGIDDAGEYIYYSPMSHESMFRIKISHLLNEKLTNDELDKQVELFGPTPQSDGITLDKEGNVYITAVEHGAISVLNNKGELSALVKDDRWCWPDGFSFGPDKWLYFTDSDLSNVIMQLRSHVVKNRPYYVWRIKALADGTPGH